MKIAVFDHTTVVWCTSLRNPRKYPHKLYTASIYIGHGASAYSLQALQSIAEPLSFGPSVCPSVCHMRDGTVSKRRKLWSRSSTPTDSPMTLDLAKEEFMVSSFVGFPLRRGRKTTVGLSTTAIFCAFAGYIFGTFRDKASIITATWSPSSAFHWFRNVNLEWPRMVILR